MHPVFLNIGTLRADPWRAGVFSVILYQLTYMYVEDSMNDDEELVKEQRTDRRGTLNWTR